jgi:hypothetical protein
MKRDTPLSERMKNIRIPDKAALWIIAFVAFAVLCLILLFAVKPLILKLLFLLLGIGAAGYCWILIESRRITPKSGQAASVPSPSPDVPAAKKRREAPEQIKTAAGTAEDPQPAGRDEHLVFVSEKGDRFHFDRQCVGLRFADSVQTMTEEEAVSLKRTPCSKCRPKASKE